MTIDHVVLVAEAQRRLDQARAARAASGSLSRWAVLYMGVTGYPQRVTNEAAVIIADTYEGRSIQEEVTYAPLAEHIAAWGPAAAVAVCEGWLDVLRRHRPNPEDPAGCWACTRLADELRPYPCVEARTVATQMGMEEN